MSEKEAPGVVEQIVFAGRRLSRGKLYYEYVPMGEGESAWYAKPMVAGHSIGAIVEITRPADEPTVYFSAGPRRPRVAGFAEDRAVEIQEWRQQDRLAALQRDQASRAKKGAADLPDDFEDALAVVQKHFRRLNISQRSALLPYVQAKILG